MSFVAEVPKLSPMAYEIQGYKYNRAIFNPTAARLGQAIAGEMSLDEALKRIGADIDEQVKAAAEVAGPARPRCAMDALRAALARGVTRGGQRDRRADARAAAPARRAAHRLDVRRAEPRRSSASSRSCRSSSTSITRSPAAWSSTRRSGRSSAARTSPRCSNATNYLDPSTCRKDLFWRAIFNTAKFAVLQVGLMVLFA